MSSRQSRTTTPVRQTTPQPGSSRSRQRGEETPPLSPTRLSRLQEKCELQHLNDRLAAYIDRVRSLELENNKLQTEVHTYEEIRKREIHQVRNLYDNEIAQLRAALDDEATRRARAEIDSQANLETKNELNAKLGKVTNDLAKLEKELETLQHRNNELKEKYQQLVSENKKLAPENKYLEKENARLQRELADKKKQLEEEMLLRIECENRIHSAEERAAFTQSMCDKQLSESTRIVRTLDISEVDNRQRGEEQTRELQELRKQYEEDLKHNRDELTYLFEEKMKALQKENERKSKMAADSYDLQKRLQNEVEQLRHEIQKLDAKMKQLEYLNSDLEKKIQRDKFLHDKEISEFNEALNKHLKEYQDLMDVKIGLDLELAAYRQLLEGEEKRLNYTPAPSYANSFDEDIIASSAGRSGNKRKRASYEDELSSSSELIINKTSASDVEISECCSDGTFVRILNKGHKEAVLGGWKVVMAVGDTSMSFKFHRSLKLEPGQTSTIWSSGSPVDHEFPHNLLMKSQKWFTGDDISIVLLNAKGEEMSTYTQRKEHREVGYSRRAVGHSLIHNGDSGDDKCSIM